MDQITVSGPKYRKLPKEQRDRVTRVGPHGKMYALVEAWLTRRLVIRELVTVDILEDCEVPYSQEERMFYLTMRLLPLPPRPMALSESGIPSDIPIEETVQVREYYYLRLDTAEELWAEASALLDLMATRLFLYGREKD